MTWPAPRSDRPPRAPPAADGRPQPPLARAMHANFEFMDKLGVEFWCFHDRWVLLACLPASAAPAITAAAAAARPLCGRGGHYSRALLPVDAPGTKGPEPRTNTPPPPLPPKPPPQGHRPRGRHPGGVQPQPRPGGEGLYKNTIPAPWGLSPRGSQSMSRPIVPIGTGGTAFEPQSTPLSFVPGRRGGPRAAEGHLHPPAVGDRPAVQAPPLHARRGDE